jgi:hypothetical protein
VADASADDSPRRRALRDKQAYLQDYPRLALRRGLGADGLADPADPLAAPAGLQQRLARLLGLADAALPLQLVEHILLRPLAADNRQQGPLMRAALSADPRSTRAPSASADARSASTLAPAIAVARCVNTPTMQPWLPSVPTCSTITQRPSSRSPGEPGKTQSKNRSTASSSPGDASPRDQ